MKKARILLAAVAVMAIVGGVYASKAKRGEFVYCSTTFGPTVKGVLKTDYTLTPSGGVISYCTIDPLSTVLTTRITTAP